MTDHADIASAAKALTLAGDTAGDFCTPFLQVLDLQGAAVSTLGDPFGSETVCASDDRAARLDEIQIDLGEGPCWQALSLHAPVLEPDLVRSSNSAWPLAMGALRETGLGAVFAFPLVVAGIDVGAIDLYSRTPRHLTDQQVRDTTLLSMILARQVFHRAVLAAEHRSEDAGSDDVSWSQREVHQATGMIVAQLRITPQDALLVLRGHAFASSRTVLDVATDVIDGTLDFSTIT
jgi:hypothetical protein